MNKIKQTRDELKKVQWPTKKETIRLTKHVIFISLAVGLFVMLFDYIFTEILSLII